MTTASTTAASIATGERRSRSMQINRSDFRAGHAVGIYAAGDDRDAMPPRLVSVMLDNVSHRLGYMAGYVLRRTSREFRSFAAPTPSDIRDLERAFLECRDADDRDTRDWAMRAIAW